MKVIAMYLPQYHEVKENSIWWGKGFTEWDAVRRAESLCEGHKQPKTPLNHNYYDLMNKETVQWQAALMKKYGIYGLCYYHYWFKDGRKILEKPAENLLKWKDVETPFCFCWANESWIRSWNKIGEGNSWMDHLKTSDGKEGDGVLLWQQYGTREDWEKHFNYLLQFFKDDRYIKLNNKPVFILYKPDKIFRLKSMVKLWNQLAAEAGFDGMYIIGANAASSDIAYDAILRHEPQATILEGMNLKDNFKKTEALCQFSYEDIWKNLLKSKVKGEKVYYGGFVNYDDTPRRGKLGTLISGGAPQKFQENLEQLYAKNVAAGNEFLFINAWNEWGEGMYLEPDEEDKYGYLEAFAHADKNYHSYLNKYEKGDVSEEGDVSMDRQDMRLMRYESYWKVLNKWLILKEQGRKIEDCLKRMSLMKIAVYGMGMLGQHLLRELSNSSIQIAYAIDRDYQRIHVDIPVISPEAEYGEADAIVITTIHLYSQISSWLGKKTDCEIISLENLLDESF